MPANTPRLNQRNLCSCPLPHVFAYYVSMGTLAYEESKGSRQQMHLHVEQRSADLNCVNQSARIHSG